MKRATRTPRPSTTTPWFRDPVVWGCLAVGAAFLFLRLGQRPLWEDEAETAVLARNLLQFGFPRAFDGLNWVWDPQGYGPNFAWIYHPWATFYLTAASFRLLGVTTWAARLPFALCGLLALPLTYRVAQRISTHRSVARWAVISLLVSVPFFLYMRQCRYYAPAAALGLAWLLAWRAWIDDRPWSTTRVVAIGALFFHVNHGIALPFGLAMALDWWGNQRRRMDWRRPLVVVAAIGALTLPWALYLQSWRHAANDISWRHLEQHAAYYFRMTNKYVLPLLFWVFVLGWRLWTRQRWFWDRRRLGLDRPMLRLVVLTLLTTLAFMLLPEQRHFRYLVVLIPLWLCLQALLLDDWVRHRPWRGGLIAALVLGTTLGSSLTWRVPLVDFVHELTHDYHGPTAAIIEHLQTHAQAGETIKAPYDHNVLAFYTPLTVEPFSRTGHWNPFAHETYPEWILPRFGSGRLREDFWQTPYGQRIRREYGEIRLAAVDLLWDNLPDPNEHQFRIVTIGPPLVLYRRH